MALLLIGQEKNNVSLLSMEGAYRPASSDVGVIHVARMATLLNEVGTPEVVRMDVDSKHKLIEWFGGREKLQDSEFAFLIE
jgi:hypothetical protein